MSDIQVEVSPSGTMRRSLAPKHLYAWLMLFWTVLIFLLVLAFYRYSERTYTQILRAQAGAATDRDLLFRSWNTNFGGVYAPGLEPNPWLVHQKRDITTNFGDSLTLINPAWMTRQINEMQKETDHSMRSRLTSSKLLNPNNVPDDWEKAALDALESGRETEVFELVDHSGEEEFVRLAKPLIVAQGCLNCHGHQGYEVGEIRGIISMKTEAGSVLAAKRHIQGLVTAAGAGIWLLGIGILLFSRHRLDTYFRGNREAIEALKEKESAIRMQRDHLELMTRNLREATSLAEEANSAKSRFLAHMSHEIRTPLNGVIGMTELLLGTDLNAKQKEYSELAHASGRYLLSLINDILDFSKIEAGKLEIDAEDFDLQSLTESALGILAARATDRKLELCGLIKSDVPHDVVGDAGRLRQVLVNLLGNAVKFTSEGGIRLTVSVDDRTDDEKPRCTVRFEVQDSGIGIPQDRLDRLFNSFAQVDSSQARKFSGTGLGLAISKELVHLMGGEIGVESEENVGSTFWFTVPFPIAQNNDSSSRIFMHGNLDLGKQRLLLVDENDVLRDTLKQQLREWGMNVRTARDREEAFAALREAKEIGKPINLALVDTTIADGPGTDLIEAMQTGEDFKDVRVILLMPLAEDINKNLAPTGRIDRFVGKPIVGSFLFDAIIGVLTGVDIAAPEHEAKREEWRREWQEQQSFQKILDDFAEKTTLESTEKGSEGETRPIILIAEDNRVNQVVVAELLEQNGFRYQIIGDGRQACEAVAARKFSLVLMDCQMPEMDGYEATRRIRRMMADREKDGPQDYLPIIALTANATREDRELCAEAGMDDYCSKPINPTKLLETIRRWVPASL